LLCYRTVHRALLFKFASFSLKICSKNFVLFQRSSPSGLPPQCVDLNLNSLSHFPHLLQFMFRCRFNDDSPSSNIFICFFSCLQIDTNYSKPTIVTSFTNEKRKKFFTRNIQPAQRTR